VITYEVQVEMRADLAESFAAYMRDKHIPEIWATGCFQSITFEQAGPAKFRSRYQAAQPKDLDRYLNEHTAAFRADFLAHFPEGAVAIREQWSELQHWP
jgi:hypothetical protein